MVSKIILPLHYLYIKIKVRMWKYIKTLNPWLGTIFMVSVISILLIDCWLIDVSAPHWLMPRIGKVYYALCLAFISSFIFHFIVVHIKSVKDKELLNGYLAEQSQIIVGACISFITTLARYKEFELQNAASPNLDEIVHLFEHTNSTEENPAMLDCMGKRHLTWLGTLQDMLMCQRDAIEKIEAKDMYVDAKLISILIKMKESNLWKVLSYESIQQELSKGSMVIISRFFHDYTQDIHALSSYINKNFAEYKPTISKFFQ